MASNLRPHRCRGCDQPISETCKVCGLPAFDDLCAQLREAQEGHAETNRIDFEAMKELAAERDAAIERGVQAYRQATMFMHQRALWCAAYHSAERRYLAAEEERDVAQGTSRFQQYLRMRLELDTAKEDAQAQRALVKRLQAEVETLRTVVNQEGHIIEFRKDGWAIEHPVECRQDNLLDCPLNFLCEAMGGPPEEGLGRYRAAIDDTGNLLLTSAEAQEHPQSGQEGSV